MDKGLIERLTPEQVEAYAAWDCGVETDKPFSARQLTILRLAYFAGWKAAEEKALADVEALKEGQSWHPIETAPRDGTWFLACATTPGWGATRVVRFHHPTDRLPIHGEGAIWPSAPTHWMSLPAPPARTLIDGGDA